MKILKYTVIKSESKYNTYLKALEDLLESNENIKDSGDEIELLTLLIEKWDAEHSALNGKNSIELLLSLMHDHNLKAKNLVTIFRNTSVMNTLQKVELAC